ncbi:MAG: hypothetical protein JWP78_1751 [Mucilaginibacter sp.]|nr:hypothetical protein [Mucilaginibacter sp.]
MRVFNKVKNRLSRLFAVKSYKLFPKSKSIKVSSDLIIGRYVNINIRDLNVHIEIDSNVIFRAFCNILVFPEGKLKIGKNVFFNNYCSINCLGEINIGDNTIIGEGVKLYDHNHEYKKGTQIKIHADRFTTSPVSIGENCWIGSNVTILKGVNIGNNVIIGANNLIYKSVPSNSIVKANASLSIQTF